MFLCFKWCIFYIWMHPIKQNRFTFKYSYVSLCILVSISFLLSYALSHTFVICMRLVFHCFIWNANLYQVYHTEATKSFAFRFLWHGMHQTMAILWNKSTIYIQTPTNTQFICTPLFSSQLSPERLLYVYIYIENQQHWTHIHHSLISLVEIIYVQLLIIFVALCLLMCACILVGISFLFFKLSSCSIFRLIINRPSEINLFD